MKFQSHGLCLSFSATSKLQLPVRQLSTGVSHLRNTSISAECYHLDGLQHIMAVLTLVKTPENETPPPVACWLPGQLLHI